MNTDTSQFAGHTTGLHADGYDVRQPAGRQCAYCGPHHTPAEEYPASCKRVDEVNARLFAAAPELLSERNELRAALENMTRSVVALPDWPDQYLAKMHDEHGQLDAAPWVLAREVLARCGK